MWKAWPLARCGTTGSVRSSALARVLVVRQLKGSTPDPEVRTSAGKHRPGRVSRFSSIVGGDRGKAGCYTPASGAMHSRYACRRCTGLMHTISLCTHAHLVEQVPTPLGGAKGISVEGRGSAAAQGP